MDYKINTEKMLELLGIKTASCYANYTSKAGPGQKLPLISKITKAGRIYISSRTKPDTWSSYNTAVKLLEQQGEIYKGGQLYQPGASLDGLFLMLDMPHYHVLALDLDHVKDGDTLDPIATEILEHLPGIAEWSMSGSGLHLFCIVPQELTERVTAAIKGLNPGKKANGEIMCDIWPYANKKNTHIEIYARYRGIALTANFIDPLPSEPPSPLSLDNLDYLERLIARDTKKNKPYDLEGALSLRNIPYIKHDGGPGGAACSYEIPCINRANHTDRTQEDNNGIEAGTGRTLVWIDPSDPIKPRSQCLHEHCQGLTAKDQLNQNGRPDLPALPQQPTQQAQGAGWPYVDSKGNPHPKIKENLAYYLKTKSINLRENDISHKIEITISEGERAAILQDHHIINLKSELAKINYNLSTQNLYDLMRTIAHDNLYNPILEWYATLPAWDHQTNYCKELFDILSPDGGDTLYPYFHKWCLQGVYLLHNGNGATYKPCSMLILKGRQGIGKGHFVINYYPKHLQRYILTEKGLFTGAMQDKDEVLTATSGALCELSEIGRSLKAQDKMKSFLTCYEDIVRKPYGHTDSIMPRKTNFIGSVNDDTFFNDNTGNRRFIVLDLKRGIPWDTINDFWSRRLSLLHSQIYTEYLEQASYELTREEITALTERNQKYNNMTDIERYLFDNYDFNQQPGEKWRTATEIYTQNIKASTMQELCKKSSPGALGRILNVLSERGQVKKRISKGTTQYQLPPLMD